MPCGVSKYSRLFMLYFRRAMAKKKKTNSRIRSLGDGMVFSTQTNWQEQMQDDEVEHGVEPVTVKQKLYVSLDRKQRAGKPVTMVEGYQGGAMSLSLLGKELKSICGVGGAVKEGVILIQGDQRERVIVALENKGYQIKRKGG